MNTGNMQKTAKRIQKYKKILNWFLALNKKFQIRLNHNKPKLSGYKDIFSTTFQQNRECQFCQIQP